VAYGYLKRVRKLARIVNPLVTAATHELTHLYRLQLAYPFDLLEHAASEGISMYAEGKIADELGIGQIEGHDIACTQRISPDAIAKMQAAIVRDNREFAEMLGGWPESPMLDELHDNWFEFDHTGTGLPDGYLLGMNGVRSRLAEGIPFPVVARMPAEQILGLE
jgi:hypothetical protein